MKSIDGLEQKIKTSNLKDNDLVNDLLQQIIALSEADRDELLWMLVWRLCEADQIEKAERAVKEINSPENSVDAELAIAQWFSNHGQCGKEMQAHLQNMRFKSQGLKHKWRRADFLHHESMIWFRCGDIQHGINILLEAAELSCESYNFLSTQNKSVIDALDSIEAITITLIRKGETDKAKRVILKVPDTVWQARVAKKLNIDLTSY